LSLNAEPLRKVLELEGKKGYAVTVFERASRLGCVLNLVPQYRLPRSVLDITMTALVRVAHIDVNFGVNVGDSSHMLSHFERDGYRAVFIGIGTQARRPLTFGKEPVAGSALARVMYGFQILAGVNMGGANLDIFRDRKLIVIGGGDVAFDIAGTARRLGGEVTVVCLECEDKSSRDGVPARTEEIEHAREEGVRIVFSRGVCEVVGDRGRFRGMRCPRCTSVWDEKGLFNPKFDLGDVIYLEGDLLLLAVGQSVERAFLEQEGLLDERGRLDMDPLTRMSNRRAGVFFGGDVRRGGFAAEAMRDGMIAAESIDRYVKGKDLGVAGEKEHVGADLPRLREYKSQPELRIRPVQDRLDFEEIEIPFTADEAIREAERCLRCGPCASCKACIALGLQPEIPEIKINEDLCGRCGICLSVCSVSAIRLDTSEEKQVPVIDEWKCKRCGTCVAACPAGAIVLKDGVEETLMMA
jgi:NADPH-dependent glutamate synthase beta subunit-like oxidoreductase